MNAVKATAAIIFLFCTWASCEPYFWNFEADTQGWRPRAKTIAVEHAAGVGANEQSRGALHVYGKINTGWNYVISPTRPLRGGRLFRLSAWVRVASIGKETPAPFFKCEFLPASGSGTLGRAATTQYDLRRMGEWQRLVGEFRAPEGTGRCWLALEKGTSRPTEIDAYIDDVVLESIPRLSALERYRLKPLPEELERVRGVHPRIFVNEQRVAELRAAIGTTHRHLWEELEQQADSAARRKPPKYILRDRYSGDEQLWQRGVGSTMPILAMAYLLTGEEKYLDAARQWALASCSYKTWGLGRIDGMDLAAGHQLFGLGIVYDWCYDELGEAARKTIRQTLIRRSSAMFEAAATGKVWWHRSYMQNHLWVNACGLAVAGFSLFDEYNDATLWLGLALDKFQRTMAALGPDGASHEGVGYWEYGAEYMLKFMHLARELLGVDMFDNEWWRNTAKYRLYLSLPRATWKRSCSIVDIADCPRYSWYGPDHILRCLAREYRDGHAQWLAEEVDRANIDSPSARWLNLIWYDPTVKPIPPTDLPTLHHFADMGIVSARSDWSGNESLVVFKCGPALGHNAFRQFAHDPGSGHVHPDANHFVIFGAGQWLIRDDGYRAKRTSQHNTLLVGGRGQLGEGQMWFSAGQQLRLHAAPRVLLARSTPALDHIVGDAAEAYPQELGLKRFVRHLLFLKPNVLIVADEIALAKAEELELRFFPEEQEGEREGSVVLVRGKQATLRLELLTPQGVTLAAEKVPTAGRHGGEGEPLFCMRLRRRAEQWRNAVALSWAPAGKQPPRVALRAAGEQWIFSAAGRTVALDWATGQAALR